jgi:hypothetical protein
MGFFLFATASRPALGPTQLPIQWVPGTLTSVVERSEHEADQSPPSSATVKNAWIDTFSPPIHLHGMVLNHESKVLTYFLKLGVTYENS